MNPPPVPAALPFLRPTARLQTRRDWIRGLAAGVLGAGVAGCRTTAPAQALERFVFHKGLMGTVFTITLFAPAAGPAKAAADLGFARVLALNDLMTDYDRSSELMRLCAAPPGQPFPLSTDLFRVLAHAQSLASRSDGAFDVTLGPFIRLWRRARRQRELPPAELLAQARAVVGHEKLVLDPRRRTATLAVDGMALDLGGIAKGYAADAALRVLRECGFPRAMVAASGDLAIGDPPPGKPAWAIGVDSIDAVGGRHTRIVQVRNVGLSTSGDTEQFVEIGGQRYSHIVDPRTGIGLRERIGVTVVAPDATTSDALATAVSVLGVVRGLALVERTPRTAALVVEMREGRAILSESRRFRRIPVVPQEA